MAFGNQNQSASGSLFVDAQKTLTVSGVQNLDELIETPLPDSEHLTINGLHYDKSDGWSRTARTVTLAAELGARAGDRVCLEYAYTTGGAVPRPVEILVPFGAAGWKYKQIAPGDATDYSGVGFDDSTWAVGTAPFGYYGSLATPFVFNTQWDGETRLWLRRTFTLATEVTLHIKIEDNATIYVNGNLVGSTPVIGEGGNTNPGVLFDVPSGYLNATGTNVIAIRCDDEYGAVSDWETTYADVEVQGRPL